MVLKYFFILALMYAGLFYNTPALSQTATIESAAISFEFPSKEVVGTIGGFLSSSKIDLENPENSVFEGSVAVATLDTRNRFRNWSLKKGKYFDADDFPRIHFKSTQVIDEDGQITVIGNLTLKGTTKNITLTFTQSGKTLIGRTSIYSSDFGIKIKKEREDNLVKVKMAFGLP